MKFVAILFLLLASLSTAQTYTTPFILETRAELLAENQDGFQRFLDWAKNWTSLHSTLSSGTVSAEAAQTILDSSEALVLAVVQAMPHESNPNQAIQSVLDTASAAIFEELRGDIESNQFAEDVSYDSLAFAVAEDLLYQLAESDRYTDEAELALKSHSSGLLNIIRLKSSILGFVSADSLYDLPLDTIEVVESGYLILKTAGVDITLATLGIAEALSSYKDLLNSSEDSAQLALLRYYDSKTQFETLVEQLPNDWNGLPVLASEKRELALIAAVAVSAIEQYELFTSIGLFNFKDTSLRKNWDSLIEQISEDNNREELGGIFQPLATSEQFIALAQSFLQEYQANLPPFEVTTESLNLGDFYFGDDHTAPRSVTIYNPRRSAVRIRLLNITPGIVFPQEWIAGVLVNAGKVCTIPIGFKPTAAGPFSTTLYVVQADDPAESPRALPFSGTAIPVPALPTYRVDVSNTSRGHVDYVNERGESLFDLPEFDDSFDHWNSAEHFKRMRNGLFLTSSNKFPQESNGELTQLSLDENGHFLANDHFFLQGDGLFRRFSELPEEELALIPGGRPNIVWWPSILNSSVGSPWESAELPSIYRAYHFRPSNLKSLTGSGHPRTTRWGRSRILSTRVKTVKGGKTALRTDPSDETHSTKPDTKTRGPDALIPRPCDKPDPNPP